MLLSGDDLTRISAAKLEMLRRMLPPSGVAARFTDDSLKVGRIRVSDKTMICLFNWTDGAEDISFQLPRACQITDFWTAEVLGVREGSFTIEAVPPHSARLLVCG